MRGGEREKERRGRERGKEGGREGREKRRERGGEREREKGKREREEGGRMGNEGSTTQTKKAGLTTDAYCLVYICLWRVLRSVKRELCTGGWRDRST